MPKTDYGKAYPQERAEVKSLDFPLLKRLWVYLYPYKNWFYISIAFLLFSKAIEAYVPIMIGQISQHILNNINASLDIKEGLLDGIVQGVLVIVSLLVFSYFLDAANVFLKSWVGGKALYNLRRQVFIHIERMPLQFFEKHTVGRLMTRTIHDVEQIDQMFTESVVPLIGSIVLFFCMIVGIFFLNWKVGIVIITILPILFALTNHFRIVQRYCYDQIRSIVAAMNTFVQEYLMGSSTIRAFGLQNKEKAHFAQINEDQCEAYMESVQNFSFFIASIDFLQNLSLILVFAVLVYFSPVDLGFQAGTFFTFSLYALMIFRPLVDLAERYNVLQSAMAASERIFHTLDQVTEPYKNPSAVTLEEIESIDFDQVWFAYEEENWILKGMTFHAKRGESIALVGITGAGKSTIMSLLLRFYDYQKGSIKINGLDIRKYSLESLRRQFGVVLQDPVIFSGTIADNIKLYQSDITDEKIEQVIDYLNIRSFINRLPGGLDHKLTERGKSLSVGEMQLISMARAVAHQRSVLILDEATANIDSGTEKIIQDALKKILHNKTALVIAHRLSTITDADRILVLHNGLIGESGTHQELLRAKGIYEKLYRLQYF